MAKLAAFAEVLPLTGSMLHPLRKSLCFRKNVRAPVDGTLTLGIGYPITPFTEFLNPLGMENRV